MFADSSARMAKVKASQPEATSTVFDPLAVENVGVILGIEMVRQPPRPLPPEPFQGAGVYAIYYGGSAPAYAPLVALDGGRWQYPVYIGKVMRSNAKQGFNPKPTTDRAIHKRLVQHAASIDATKNIKSRDFRCRYLVLNDAYIGLAESVLITLFRPAWNGMGFGSKVVGKFRETGTPSAWDCLHPGRLGRPAGNLGRAAAKRRIIDCVARLSEDPADPRTKWMLDRIRHFL
jgi:hypothetical protein